MLRILGVVTELSYELIGIQCGYLRSNDVITRPLCWDFVGYG